MPYITYPQIIVEAESLDNAIRQRKQFAMIYQGEAKMHVAKLLGVAPHSYLHLNYEQWCFVQNVCNHLYGLGKWWL